MPRGERCNSHARPFPARLARLPHALHDQSTDICPAMRGARERTRARLGPRSWRRGRRRGNDRDGFARAFEGRLFPVRREHEGSGPIYRLAVWLYEVNYHGAIARPQNTGLDFENPQRSRLDCKSLRHFSDRARHAPRDAQFHETCPSKAGVFSTEPCSRSSSCGACRRGDNLCEGPNPDPCAAP